MKIILKIIGIGLAIIVGFYAIIHIVLETPFSLMLSKPRELQNNTIWSFLFLLHVLYGGIALTVGWCLFSKRLLTKWRKAHKMLGYFYVSSVLISSSTGVYIAFYADGGWVASLGFVSASIVWFYVTIMAVIAVRKGQLKMHRNLMIYSYALSFSAVTFRIWNPLLNLLLNDEMAAYQVSAWESWLTNLFVAFLIIRNRSIKLK